ncbi:MAG TPA: alpha/beta hydrolase [Gemmatimonadaceae bacterium]|nr:alpha/beta hydrolase [Gemmatimonadaceae bacterium]
MNTSVANERVVVTGLGAANAAHTQVLRAGDIEFAYRTFGADSDVPIVLLARFRATMDDWDPAFLDALAAERRVVIFDNAGVGRSSGESPASIAGMAEHAGAFIRGLGYSLVDLLGWSMGGAVAQALALKQPELVRRLVVAGSGPGGVPGAPPMSERVRETVAKPVNSDDDFLYLFFEGSDERRAAGREHLRRLHRRVESDGPPTRMQTDQAMGRALVAWSAGGEGVYSQLHEIRQPVLVATGVHDVMIPAYNSYAMIERLPNAELVIYSDAGHGFLFQHAEKFGRRVLQFLG